MGIKQVIKKLILKVIDQVNRRVMRIISKANLLEYASDGWETVLDDSGWNSSTVVDAEKAKWHEFCAMVGGTGPLGFHHEQTKLTETRSVLFHNINITYGYVLALAAHNKSSLSVLDYGGGLGHYYKIGKALLPEVKLNFSCKEIPIMAEAGKLLNPDIQWYSDDSCFDSKFDLVMITSSLQYIEHWQEFINDIAKSVGDYFFLTRIPIIEKSETYVAIQKTYDTKMRHWIFNKHSLLQVVERAGFTLVREFVLGERHYIINASEQCELCSWLFRKRAI